MPGPALAPALDHTLPAVHQNAGARRPLVTFLTVAPPGIPAQAQDPVAQAPQAGLTRRSFFYAESF
jgi:hypothetical protein